MANQATALPRATAPVRTSQGVWWDALARLRKNRLAVVGFFVVVFLALVAILGPTLAPWPYYIQDTQAVVHNNLKALTPFQNMAHPLGTDGLGQDIMSRLMDGAQISLTVAIVVQVVVIGLGVPIGAIAGWRGGRTDTTLMRFTDVMYAFPDLLLIILFSVAFRQTAFGQAMNGLLLVFVAIGLTSWVTVARLVRGQILSLKETEFIEAAHAIGVPSRKIITRHLLPNSMSPIIVAVTLGIPAAILAEATLAYIGVGVQPPRASWGSLIAEGQKFIRVFPHLTYLPGLAIAVALVSFTFLGDGLRDALDPKLKGKQ